MAASRIETEKLVVGKMIALYCRGQRHGASGLCPFCAALLAHAHKRLDRCRFGEEKPFCRLCPIHCYPPEMRVRIKNVMRYAGPRMLLYHPLVAVKHLANQAAHAAKKRGAD